MSAHHFIHNHCTNCGVKREKVRVQGPCNPEFFIPDAFKSEDKAREPAPLHDVEAFKAHLKATVDITPTVAAIQAGRNELAELISQANKAKAAVIYERRVPYNQNPLFEIVPQARSIEPHKKRRAK